MIPYTGTALSAEAENARWAKANPNPGVGIAHDFDCTHDPCTCEDNMTSVSDCHSYSVGANGVCNWCGVESGTHPYRDDPLLQGIEAALCDWNSPSRLDSHDLKNNVHRVAILILKERAAALKEDQPDD